MITAVMFSTSTCGHCKPFKKTLEDVAEMYDEDEFEVMYRVIDTEPESAKLAEEWGINQVPITMFISNKFPQIILSDALVGNVPQKLVVDKIQEMLHRE